MTILGVSNRVISYIIILCSIVKYTLSATTICPSLKFDLRSGQEDLIAGKTHEKGLSLKLFLASGSGAKSFSGSTIKLILPEGITFVSSVIVSSSQKDKQIEPIQVGSSLYWNNLKLPAKGKSVTIHVKIKVDHCARSTLKAEAAAYLLDQGGDPSLCFGEDTVNLQVKAASKRESKKFPCKRTPAPSSSNAYTVEGFYQKALEADRLAPFVSVSSRELASDSSITTAEKCYQYCSIYGTVPAPFCFNWHTSDKICLCPSRKGCTLVYDADYTTYEVGVAATSSPTVSPTQNPTSPSLAPSFQPTGRPTALSRRVRREARLLEEEEEEGQAEPASFSTPSTTIEKSPSTTPSVLKRSSSKQRVPKSWPSEAVFRTDEPFVASRIAFEGPEWYFGMTNPEIILKMEAAKYLFGAYPEILSQSSSSMQMKLDLVTGPDAPRWNPSIKAVGSTSKASSFASYIGTVRGGLDGTLLSRSKGNSDPVTIDGETYGMGGLFPYDTEEFCDLVFLDEKFNTLIQTPIQVMSVTGEVGVLPIHDCRLLDLQGQLYLYGVRYNVSTPESFLYPLEYVVRGTASGRFLMAEAQAITSAVEDTDSLLRGVEAVHGKEVNHPLKGKNHIFFQDHQDDTQTYIINYLHPLEIWAFNKKDRHLIEQVPATFDFGPSSCWADLKHFNLNGGQMIYLPEINEYLGMAHRHHDFDLSNALPGVGSHYTQAFFTISATPPFHIKQFSNEFCFATAADKNECEAIQFSCQFDRSPDGTIVIAYGAMDLEAMVYTLSLDDVLAMLKPVPSPKPDRGEECIMQDQLVRKPSGLTAATAADTPKNVMAQKVHEEEKEEEDYATILSRIQDLEQELMDLSNGKQQASSSSLIDHSLPFPVYYINMDKSTDRRKRMEDDFGKLWDLKRSQGIDATNVERLMGKENFEKIKPRLLASADRDRVWETEEINISPQELGAILSHLSTIRQAYLDGYDIAMIMEDDISPSLMTLWTARITDMIQELENDSSAQKSWNSIQLYWTCTHQEWCVDAYAEHSNHPLISPQLLSHPFEWGAAAYLISRAGMKAVIDQYFSDDSPQGLIQPLVEGREIWIENYLKVLPATYLAMPPLFITDYKAESTISNDPERAYFAALTTERILRANLELHKNDHKGQEEFDQEIDLEDKLVSID